VTMQRENVHLLIIEDSPRFLKEALQWLQEEFGYREVLTATSVADGEEKLKDSCDIVIADMRMEQDDSGFTILDYVQRNNLSTVVIILTANDTVTDCRRAFREGAWDYISKNMRGSCFEALDASIQDAIAYLNRWGNRPNQQWLEANRSSLEAQYWGQWIAIVNQTVIETADTESELLKRLEERKLRRFTTTIQSIGDLRPIPDLIALGENDRLEFKSTLQWDIRENRKNEGLQQSCLKTIAAFLNTAGGVLLIGAQDDGTVLGLESDLQCMNNGSLDKFERHLMQLIENRIGKQFLLFIKIRFNHSNEKDICGVYVKQSSKKAFLKSEKGLELYVRTGNATKSLTVPEIYEFL
jgi:DNA-binding NarL/FixJ family response regulator